VRVIDASALSKYILKEKGWEKVEPYLHLADSLKLVQLETANAIWKNQHLKRISKQDSRKMFNSLEKLCQKTLMLHESSPYLNEAFKFAIHEGVAIYDVLYIRFALDEKGELITIDENQARLARKLEVKVKLV